MLFGVLATTERARNPKTTRTSCTERLSTPWASSQVPALGQLTTESKTLQSSPCRLLGTLVVVAVVRTAVVCLLGGGAMGEVGASRAIPIVI